MGAQVMRAAFGVACKALVEEHRRLLRQEETNARLFESKGELSEEAVAAYGKIQKDYEALQARPCRALMCLKTLVWVYAAVEPQKVCSGCSEVSLPASQKSVASLAETLDKAMPELPKNADAADGEGAEAASAVQSEATEEQKEAVQVGPRHPLTPFSASKSSLHPQ
jgi:hypothetical protein